MARNLINEDRDYGGDELYIDLIPKSCWFTNVRYCIKKKDWDILRKIIYERTNYKCECCGIDCKKEKIQIEAHERWHFDYTYKTQKLVRLIALCKNCHLATHYGFAKISGKEQEAYNHLLNTRKCNIEELNEHISLAYALWNERNQYDWSLDLELILKNNFEIVKPVKKEERKKIVENKLL